MKTQIYLAVFFIFTIIGNAQNSNVEKNVAGIQFGLFGFELYNESKIAEKTTLRVEASLFPAIWGGDFYDNTVFAIYPAFTLQPKYYYNIQKRAGKGKNTKNNSANYFGLQLRYIPDWFVISSDKSLRYFNQFHIIPTFGFRRNFSENFNYEFKFGLGYGTTFGNDNKTSGAVLDLSLKVGYDF